MKALLANGWVLDVIMAGMLVEGAVLTLLHRLRRTRLAPGAVWPNLAAGLCLLLAMRLALAGAWWGFVSAGLFGALVMHVVDLRNR